jgi:molybdopterin molybdotransferase
MISVQEAKRMILDYVQPKGIERVTLLDALGRVLAEEIYASRDHPPWDNSAMDGYAVRWKDVQSASRERPVVLSVVEEIPAGYLSKRTIGPGEAARIMTGAPVPQGG